MPLLIVCVVLFFSLAQLYQWSSDLTLPFPVLLLAGAGLAVVSNLQTSNLRERRSPELASLEIQSVPVAGQAVSSQPAAPAVLPPDIRPAVEPRSIAEPQLPQVTPPIVAEPQQSISFTLKQSDRPSTAENSPEKDSSELMPNQ